MQLVLVTDGIYPFVIGGMQKHSFFLAKYLALSGVKIDLYHYRLFHKEKKLTEFFGEEAMENINSFELEFPKHKALPFHYLRESKEFSEKMESLLKEFLMKSSQEDVDSVYSLSLSGVDVTKGTLQENEETL